ncbi:Ig-like domain-containing protein [Pseudomonas sp. CAN2814]|uniref:Ig-like domain-containing protein n=1 Tax=Pseudomonas sp. CAN1 TaxID=3046726 RepID=UPI0026488F95|nr:Ig-like domain-containing protein [Pseudomonas sp. CAN1]MDN6860110.1 Ig-like domain-containing protein [Pseudomonas sp. CAN1]
MMFDGAVAATTAEVAKPTDAQDGAAADKAGASSASKDNAASHAAIGDARSDAGQGAEAGSGRNVVFVDSRVEDAQQLLQGVAANTDVVFLDSHGNGVQQMAQYLAAHPGAASVQIIAHGNSGDLWLGNSYVSAENIADYGNSLSQLGASMQAGGDILIYACNTAQGERGQTFVNELASLTGRDIAASDDRTGNGSDWDLEVTTGVIEARPVLSAAAEGAYQHSLAILTVTTNNDSGADLTFGANQAADLADGGGLSLREAINWAASSGDTITFSSAMTVGLTSQLVINKSLIIDGDINNDGVADVTLDANYHSRVLQVQASSNVTLDGLVITRGLVSGDGSDAGSGLAAANAFGGGIWNAGTLTLLNTSVTANAAAGGGGGGGNFSYDGGGGGGGGALGGGIGGRGGESGVSDNPGTSGSVNQGGRGGADSGFPGMGGQGGTGVGGAGGSYLGYSTGGSGGTATNGSISIGGGGGGLGTDATGGAGGSAAGGIYNAVGGTINVIGNSVISNNLGAGGGGGGGGAGGSLGNQNGGAGGRGVGAVWNKGTFNITADNTAAMTNNGAGSGAGGQELGTGSPGPSSAAVTGIYNDGGVLDTAYVAPPTATIAMSDTALNIGETALVTFTFSQPVTGFTNADLTVTNGTLTALSSSDGGQTWTATFTPNPGVTSASNVITLDNTGVTSVAGSVAGSGTSTSNNYTIDTVRPTASVVVASSALKAGSSTTVNITFSEPVTGFTLGDISASNGTLSNLTTSDNIHWTATLTPDAGNSSGGNVVVLDNTLYTDVSGNTGSGVTLSNTYSVDTALPTATVVVSNTSLNVGGSSQVTITFSETVSGFTLDDLSASNGTLSNLTTSNGLVWTATLVANSGITQSSNVVTLNNSGYTDVAGNTGLGTTTSNNYAIDTQRPTATIVFSNPHMGIGQTSLVTITFSEAVTGFNNADLDLSGANGTLSAVSSSDGGVTWTATFTPTSGIDNATNVITLQNAGVSDAAGNAGSGTTTSNSYAIDSVRPSATVVVGNSSLIIGQTAQVTIIFSEAVIGFSNADLTVSGGTLSAVSSSDGGITWTATFTPTSNITNASNVITLDNTGYTDVAGNTGTGTSLSNNYAIDTQRPTATIVVSDPVLNAGETTQVTITFSEAVTGFTLADLSASHGSLTNLSSSDGGVTWTATFTPDANTHSASNVITLANTGLADVAGNAGVGTTSSTNYSIDTVRPNATIVVSNPMLAINGTSLVTISFDQAVTGFTNSDLTVVGGTLSAVSSSDGGITWTATFTPAGNITSPSNHITLDNSGLQAATSGNTGAGITTSNNYSIDTQRPTATIVVANDHLGIGGSSPVTITFSEAVTGFTLADLTSPNGTLSNLFTSDNVTWTATLTPAAGVNAGNNHVSLDNTGVTDLAGNVGSGSTNSNAYAVDGIRPTATIVMDKATLAAGETSTVTVTFSEAVTGLDNTDLSAPNGTLGVFGSSDGGITWTATYTPNAGVRDTTNVLTLNNTGYTDLAGNTGTGVTTSANFTVDTVRPTATIVVASPALNAGSTSLVTITFSEAVTGFTNADLSLADANGTLSAVSSADGGITWTATFTPSVNVTDTTNLITLDNNGVQNASGNSGSGTTTSNNYAIDTQRPTATITVANPNIGIGQTTTVTIAFSEVVNGFNLGDLSVPNGTLSNLASSDGGKTWTATLTPTAGLTDPTNLIVLDTALVTDVAGNAGSGVSISNNYVVDGVRPTASIVVADDVLGIGETSLVTITFSEQVSGLDLSDLVVSGGVLSNLATGDGGKTWTATLTPSVETTQSGNLISLDTSLVQDMAGNSGASSVSSNAFAVDTQRPTASIVVADSALKAGQSTQVTITFSEAVSGFDNSDLTVNNGTLSAVSSSDGGITWTATFTPGANVTDATNLIVLDNSGVSDLAGNTGSGSTASNNYAIDTARPTATIVVAEPSLAIGQTSQVSITFSEAVSGFDNADLSVANGTLSAVSSSDGGLTWTATFTPNANVSDTRAVISLDNSGYTDAAGNTGSGTTLSNGVAIDTARPTASIVLGDSALKAGQTTTVTITFSEAVSGFSNADLSVAGGTLSAVSSSDGGVTWTATFTPAANLTSTGNAIVLDNTGYTDAAGNSGAGTTSSGNYAIDTQRPTATIEVASTDLRLGQSSQVTIRFSEAVSGLDLSDLSASNATLSGLSSSDGGRTWTATLTPLINVVGSSNVVTLNNLGYTDAAGNTGLGVSQSNSYAINSIAQEGDPQYRTEQGVRPVQGNNGLSGNAPQVPSVLVNAGPPSLGQVPLLDSSNRGAAQSTLGSVFRDGPSQTQLALIFSNNGNSAFGDGGGRGFLGFGGGDAGVFSSSTLGSIFGEAREGDEQALSAFGQRQGGIAGGLSGVFAGTGLGQQLQEMNQREQRQVADLAQAFGELGQVRPAS